MTQKTRRRGFLASSEGLKKLEARMREKGYTQEKLAEEADVVLDRVKRLCNPQWGKKIQKDGIEAIAKVLDLEPSDIVDGWYPCGNTSEQQQNSPCADLPDWRKVCRAMLKEQQDKQRLRRQATEMGFEVNVHVPLGLVERKQQQRRDGNVERNQLYQLDREVIAKTYQHDEFLTEVIGQRQARKNKHIAIVGEPEAGKTTLLGAIASFIQSNTEDLPICITLASLQGRTLEDYLLKTWLSETMGLVNPEVVVTPEIKDDLIKQFRKGGVWLLLDGVDEMGADSPVQALATIQKQLTDWLEQARLVLTCRLNVWDANVNNILTGFDTYRTQEFTHEQIDQFIQEWFSCAGDAQRGEQLQTKLKEPGRERIRELVKHPLRLALLCQIFYLDKQGDLPETKAALYRRFTCYFYEWKQNLHLKDSINQDELHQALGKLALAGINSKARLRLKQSLACQEMEERLFKLACDLGWLNLVDRDVATDEPVYAFFHANFQEYFAALAVEDGDYFLPRTHDNQNPKPVQDTYRIFESHWKEVILLWLGREDVPKQEKEEFIKALVEFEDGCKDFYRHRAYFLAASGISEFRDCQQTNEIVEQIVNWSFGYFDEEEQKWLEFHHEIAVGAEEVLEETDREKIIPALLQRLQTIEQEGIRYLVALKLGEIDQGNETAINVLVQIMQTTHDEDMLRVVALVLGSFSHENKTPFAAGNETAIDALIQVIETTQDIFIRWIAVRSLAQIDKENFTDTSLLFELNFNIIYEDSRHELAVTLSKNDKENPTAINDLVQQIQVTQDESERWIAAWRLAEIGKGNEQVIAVLVQLLQTTEDESTRQQVANSLGKIANGNEAAINALVKLIQTTWNETTRCRAVFSLGEIATGNETAFTTLRELIQISQDEQTCCQVVASLGRIMQGQQCPKLVTALKNYLTDQVKENHFALYKNCYSVLWQCAQELLYSDFYRALHGAPSPVQTLENQFADIVFQLQPTAKTYPITINAQALEGETDISAIAQELCNQIYLTVFPDELEIPEVSNAPQLKRLIPKIKKQLQKQNLALIVDKCEPNQEQVTFCRKLSDVLHIAWITNQPLEPPLRGFLPNQPNLLSAIQSWIDEID